MNINRPGHLSSGNLALLSAGNSPAELTATQFRAAFAARQLSAIEYVRACVDRIELLDPAVHAWKVFNRENAERRAKAIDAQGSGSRATEPLGGVPLGVKDIFNTYDFPTGMGSPIMEHYTPGNDARVVSNARLAGGIVLGKTVTAEFAVHNPGPTLNPWDFERSPGTSSSGSAVAVATRMVPVAFATQTAGSIIRPASYCGIFAFKPSFGLIPRTGVLKTTDTLDSVGFMARSMDDLALMFAVCRVRGHNYPVSETALNDRLRQYVTGRPWRVGVVSGPKSDSEMPAVKTGITAIKDKLATAGCDVFDYTLPSVYGEVHDLHETIYRRAVAYYFGLEWGTHAELFSAIMQDMINSGLATPPKAYLAAIERQHEFQRRFDADCKNYDVLICPSTADEAPVGLDGRDLPDHCLIWTFVGAPVISVPVLAGSSGLPVGMQVVARRFDDYKLIAFAKMASEVLFGR